MGKRFYLNLQSNVAGGVVANPVSFNVTPFMNEFIDRHKTYKCRVVFFAWQSNPGGTNKFLCIHLPDLVSKSAHFAYGSDQSYDCDAVLTLNRTFNGNEFVYEGSGGEHLWFEGQFHNTGNFRVFFTDGPLPYTPSAGVNFALKLQFEEAD